MNHILRKKINEQRSHLTLEERISAAQKIEKIIVALASFQESHNIAAYIAFRGEVDVKSIIENTSSNQKIYLPILNDKDKNQPLHFMLFTKDCKMHKNKFGILEPDFDPELTVPPQNLDLVLTPLVGFDKNCNRLGQGCAYYDRTFAFKKNLPPNSKPILVGIAYEMQKIEKLGKNPWDVAMDFVITEKRIYRRF